MDCVESRRRINVRQNAKGDLQWDATVEIYNKSNQETFNEMKELIKIIKEQLPKRLE